LIAGKWYCDDCGPEHAIMNPGKNLWDFETSHFTGQRTHVRSLRHLDELCKAHGVSNFARENNTANW
jgi:hypothetical protein